MKAARAVHEAARHRGRRSAHAACGVFAQHYRPFDARSWRYASPPESLCQPRAPSTKLVREQILGTGASRIGGGRPPASVLRTFYKGPVAGGFEADERALRQLLVSPEFLFRVSAIIRRRTRIASDGAGFTSFVLPSGAAST